MFIKQLYQYNKYWLAVFLCFILFFFYLNYKWGVVATPVYQYGMFSGRYAVKDTISVYQFYIDEAPLNPAVLHFTEKDMLFTMAEKYERTRKHPMEVYETMRNVWAKTGLANLTSKDKYQQPVTASSFANWLLYYSGHRARQLKLLTQQYLWVDDQLQPVNPAQMTGIETN